MKGLIEGIIVGITIIYGVLLLVMNIILSIEGKTQWQIFVELWPYYIGFLIFCLMVRLIFMEAG